MKKFFIGIDVSKEKIDASVIYRKNDISIERFGHEVFENSKTGFLAMLKWTKELTGVKITSESAMFCCETTGSYDLKLCDFLSKKKQFIWRENALQIKRSLGLRRGKDDVADSWAIAEYALRHLDKAVEFNPLLPEVKELKELVNYRESLVRRKKAAQVRMDEISITAVKKSKALGFIRRNAEKEVTSLDKSIKECDKQILVLINSNEELKKNYLHIVSIPGIALVNASALIAYTNNFTNFKSANALATYMGLVAFRELSGTSVNKAVRVGCYSNRQLKAYMTQAARCAIRYNRRIGAYYIRLKEEEKKHHGIAINNVRNKLVHILYSLVKHDCDYEENHEEILKFQKTKAS